MQTDHPKGNRQYQENQHIKRTSQFLTKTLGKESFADGAAFNELLHECEQQNQEEVFRGTPRANSHVDGERGKRSEGGLEGKEGETREALEARWADFSKLVRRKEEEEALIYF